MGNTLLQNVLVQLGASPITIDKKNLKVIHEVFPVPREYNILWADVVMGRRISGCVITDKAIIFKADEKTVAAHNKTKAEKKDHQNAIYHLIKWEYFDPDSFKCEVVGETTKLVYGDNVILNSASEKIAKVFSTYKIELEKIVKSSVATTASIFSDFESVIPANFAAVNTATGHGSMAEEALTLLDKMSGNDAETIGRTNVKNGADRIVNGVSIQTKYCSTGTKCVESCFDKTTGLFRYMENGTPMQVEVPSDQYVEAIEAFRKKIISNKVPSVTNPDDASKYIRRGKLTYQQALNLCKAGTIESLAYDAATGAVHCSFAFGISFLVTYIMCYTQTGDKGEALRAAFIAGIQVFGLSFMTHVITSQVARTALTKQLIPMSTYLVKSLGYKTTQRIVNAIRAMSGKTAISGSAASKQLAKILRSNLLSSVITFFVFAIPDSVNVYNKKLSGAQYTKNMLSLVGAMLSAGGGTIATSMVAAKAAAVAGTSVSPGVGTAIGFVGGLTFGIIGGSITKGVGDFVREDDSVILTRMYNGVVLNLVFEYMLQENELDSLVEQFNQIKSKSFQKLFKQVIGAEQQDKVIDNFVRPYFDEIVKKRKNVPEPTADEVAELLKRMAEENDEE